MLFYILNSIHISMDSMVAVAVAYLKEKLGPLGINDVRSHTIYIDWF